MIAFSLGLVKILNRDFVKSDEYPHSIVGKVNGGGEQKIYKYSVLPYPILFNGTDVLVSIGGTECYADDEGTTFKYADDVYLSAIVSDTSVTQESLLKTTLFKMLCSSEQIGTYDSEAEFTLGYGIDGYANTLEVSYLAGKLSDSHGNTYYALSYKYDTSDGHRLLICASSKDMSKLSDDIEVLNKMYYTFVKYSGDDDDESVVVDEDSSSDTNNDTKTEVKTGGTSDSTEPGNTTVDDAKSNTYQISQYHADELTSTTTVTDKLSQYDATFVFVYTQRETVAEDIYIEDPNGNKFEPTDNNSSLTGEVIFEISNPMAGEWTLHADTTNRYGTYQFYVASSDAMNASYTGDFSSGE